MVSRREKKAGQGRGADERLVAGNVRAKIAVGRRQLCRAERRQAGQASRENRVNARGGDFFAVTGVFHRRPAHDASVPARYEIGAGPEDNRANARGSLVEHDDLSPHRSHRRKRRGHARDERGPTAGRQNGGVCPHLAVAQFDPDAAIAFDQEPFDRRARTDLDLVASREKNHQRAQQSGRVDLRIVGEMRGPDQPWTKLGLDFSRLEFRNQRRSQTSCRLPRDLLRELGELGARSRDMEYAGRPITDVQPAGLLEDRGPRRPGLPRANKAINVLLAPMKLRLRAQYSRRGARGFGPRHGALEDDYIRAPFRETERRAASHDATAHDRDAHRHRIEA